MKKSNLFLSIVFVISFFSCDKQDSILEESIELEPTNTFNKAAYSISVSQILLGDMNGDCMDDVFYPTGSRWLVSYGGTSGCTQYFLI